MWTPMLSSRRRPLSSLALGQDLDRLFGQMLGPTAKSDETLLSPTVDVAETEDGWRFEAEIPGLAPDDVEVTLLDGVLTVAGTKRSAREESQDDYRHVERSLGRFSRSFRVPGPINEAGVEARFEHGVLTISVPKAAEATRRIPVTVN